MARNPIPLGNNEKTSQVAEQVPPPPDQEDVQEKKEAAKRRAATLFQTSGSSSMGVNLKSPAGTKSLKSFEHSESSSEAVENEK